jgi:ribonuclease J
MVDCGVSFYDRVGIEVLTPDPTFIAEQRDALVGLVVTHAHEDHVGAIPYLWPHLRCPIYATPFTAEIIRNKIADRPWRDEVDLIEVPLGSTIEISDFKVEFVTITHSIPEPNVLAITTPLGTVIHTGDWKLDDAPLIGDATDCKRLQELGDKGVRALVCDSTSAFVEGHSGSEKSVREELIRLIESHPTKRITVACFASNVARLETALKAAKATGRKVALVGRSLKRMTDAAMHCGHLSMDVDIIDPQTANRLPPHQVLLVSTGSQGEPRAALTRMANRQHPDIVLGPQDIVFFSSRMIPGNEKSIGAMQNALVRLGVQIITSHEEDIHVSGHPAREELKQMYAWIRPELIVPVHGEARHLFEQAKLAKENGVPQAIVPANGSLIQLSKKAGIIGEVVNGRWALDGNRMVPLNSYHIKERFKASMDGVVVAVVYVNTYGELTRKPTFTFVGLCEDEQTRTHITTKLCDVIAGVMNGDFSNDHQCHSALIKNIKHTFKRMFDRKPLVDVHLAVSEV